MIEIQFLINVIGMAIIDIGAFAYMSIYDESQIIALIMLMLGNGVGGVLYKYSKKNKRRNTLIEHNSHKFIR